jgi:hypothetical protein
MLSRSTGTNDDSSFKSSTKMRSTDVLRIGSARIVLNHQSVRWKSRSSDIVDAKPVFRVLCSQHLLPVQQWLQQATFRIPRRRIEKIYSAPLSRARSVRRLNGTISFYIARSLAWCLRRNSFRIPIRWSERSKRS